MIGEHFSVEKIFLPLILYVLFTNNTQLCIQYYCIVYPLKRINRQG